jgi:Flp pilus assembly protein TadB
MITKIQQTLLMAAAAVTAMLVAVAAIFRSGQKSERARQDTRTREALETRSRTDDEIRKASPDQRRDDLGRWVRKD